MRPSSSASIACIASPAWSGFNRFYQHYRYKTLTAGKSLRAQKRPGEIAEPLSTFFSKLSRDDGGDDDGDGGPPHLPVQPNQPEPPMQ
jgi:hypothetical protein